MKRDERPQSYGRHVMDKAMRFDQEAARDRGELRRIGKDGRMYMQCHIRAVMNAVNTEGREVLQDDGYWEDMRRRYPWTDTMPDKGIVRIRAGAGRKTRFGKSKYTKVYG